MSNQQIKKPTLVWVIIGFVSTIALFAAYSELIEDMWYVFMMFIVWDISSLVSYFNRLSAYKKSQKISSELQESQVNSIPLANPAKIAVIRESSIIGAIISYKVYVNNSYVGSIKNGKTLEVDTAASRNIIMVTDHNDNAFSGEKIIDLAEGGRAEIRVKAGRFVK